MPKTHNTAATSTRKMAADRRRTLLLWGIFALVAIIVIFVIMNNPEKFGMGGIGFLVLLFGIRLIPDLFDSYARKQQKKIRRADRGADAEEKIGDMLEELGEDFEVIHDIDSAYGNIDHLVISRRGGIFMVETKSHRGTITTTESEILLNGHAPEKDFIAQSLRNSYWCARRSGASHRAEAVGYSGSGFYQRLCQCWEAGQGRASNEQEVFAQPAAKKRQRQRHERPGVGKARESDRPAAGRDCCRAAGCQAVHRERACQVLPEVRVRAGAENGQERAVGRERVFGLCEIP